MGDEYTKAGLFKRSHGVYAIACNGIVYVGCSVDVDRRIREHFGELKQRKHTTKLMNIASKYARIATAHILESSTRDPAMEYRWIRHLVGRGHFLSNTAMGSTSIPGIVAIERMSEAIYNPPFVNHCAGDIGTYPNDILELGGDRAPACSFADMRLSDKWEGRWHMWDETKWSAMTSDLGVVASNLPGGSQELPDLARACLTSNMNSRLYFRESKGELHVDVYSC